MRYEITIPDDAEPGRFGVYALLDAEGEPLYIGLTGDLYQRLRNHRSTQPWWKSVRSLEWTACDGSTEARAVEKSMIATFHPDANVVDARPLPRQSKQHVPDWMAAKLVELLEAEKAAGRNSPERDLLNCYLAALRAAGWRLEPLGLPMHMTRERVRQRVAMAPSAKTSFCVTTPPSTRKPKPVKPARPVIPTAVLFELKRLQADARKVNGPTPLDSPLRVASERYSEMLAEQYLTGVSIYRISQQLGVTPLAIKARLARHGYLEEIKGLPSNIRYGERTHPRIAASFEESA